MSDQDDELGLGSSCSFTVATPVKPPRKKVKQWYQHGFYDEWLKDSELKDWIKPDSVNRHATMCTVCSCTLSYVNRMALLAHKTTQKHMKNFEAKNKTLNIGKFFNKPK
jgi:hypothetical protein